MKKVILAILAILLAQSCTIKDDQLERVLKISRENRGELEKVLNYYSSPKDSLKYKAAVFIIKNMPYHSYMASSHADKYDTVYSAMLNFDQTLLLNHDSLTNRAIRQENFGRVWNNFYEKFGEVTIDEFKTKNDIEEVKAEYLIDNIEYAFKAWRNPWSIGYSFDQFCQYILPYRIGNEPLEAWRPYMYEKLKWVQDSLKNTNNPVEVCNYINKWIQNTIYDDRLGEVSPSGIKVINLFRGKIWSNCYDQTALGISILRTLGIAAAACTVPHWGIRSGNHEFNSVMDNAGKWHYFSTGYLNTDEFYLDTRAPKLYLTKFFAEPESVDPKLYQSLTSKDITSILLPVVDIIIPDTLIKSDIYLCTYDKQNWVPLVKGIKEMNKIKFTNMGREMVYLPATLVNGKIIPISNPIIVNENGVIKQITSKQVKISHTFTRKYPILFSRIFDPRCIALIGGRFQVADNINFNNAQDLFIITDKPDLSVQNIKIKSKTGKYVRYIFPPVEYAWKNGPAFIGFYDSDFRKIEGTYISSDGVTKDNMDQIFDEDLLSHVKSIQYDSAINFRRPDIILNKVSKDSLWVGMKLQKSESISHIKYCARNDKNGIYNGMQYELFYWNKDKWLSLGIKKATGTKVRFDNIPSGALLWLRNRDEGEDERIFVINKGKIIWM